MDNELRKKTLENSILKHKNLYYQGKPEISDFSYDALEEELKELSPDSPVLSVVGSSHFVDEKVEHDKKMLSLNKTYKLEDLIKWSDNKEVLSTFKIDGSSCSLIYKDGKFVLGKTRGDGRFGENISKKILFIDHVPKKLNKNLSIEVRGEVYCTEESFLNLSEIMTKQGMEKPTSQRNIVAGLLGRKENIDLSEYLSFQAFELFSDDLDLNSEEDKFHMLQSLGFETPEFFLNKTKEDFQERLTETREFLTHGNYLIDGLVFSFNDLNLHNTMGETAHHPRYKMAFKFQGETKQTLIESISWQVSRNGILTPVANVKPVELDVDTKYDAKVFLDTNLNIVNRSEADYSYILFVGVSTGNTIINFRNVHGQDTNKIIYLAPKEIYYEPNFYAEVSTDSISFFEEGLRSKCIGMLDIDSDKIAPWSHEGIVSKKSMNTHNVSKMLYPLGTRKYFDLSHFEKNIFVGRWSEEKVILPNQEYADSILNNFEIEANECMVQVNLSKDVKHINITGLSETGYMNTELRFLDKNGNFYDEVSSHSNRVFIAGEEQGLINIKLEYIDGSKQYLQTFCSESTYLVEQL